jgi:hypothetical protein
MNRNIFILILLFLFTIGTVQQTHGQQNDFQFWPSVQLNVEVIKDLKLHVEEELRLNENISQFSRQINDIGVSYRLNKYAKAAVFYRIEADWKNADEYTWRSGIYGDVSLKYELKRFSIGYRLLIQSSKVEMNDKQAYILNGFRHRHKITVDYNIKGIPLLPFIEGELFVENSSGKGSEISGYRSGIGVSYSLGKMHDISLKYGIDQELNSSDPLRAYIIALGYSLNLKLESVKRYR